MTDCLIGLGSNLGEKQQILESAVATLAEHLDDVRVSPWYSCPAVGGPGNQEDFLNGCVRANCATTAAKLVELLHAIEKEAGRERTVRWSSRTLDCDLLLFGDQQIDTQTLVVPHPRMITRRFVLEPACEIAGDMVHPFIGWTIDHLYQNLMESSPHFCVIGSSDAFVNEVAGVVHEEVGGRLLDRKCLSSTRSIPEEALEWTLAVDGLIASEASAVTCTFWAGEPWLYASQPALQKAASQIRMPRLLIVTDPRQSDFGRQFDRLPKGLRCPTLFLSGDRDDAIQDAVGAVLAMS